MPVEYIAGIFYLQKTPHKQATLSMGGKWDVFRTIPWGEIKEMTEIMGLAQK
jgi:hypothetical protein